jgi:ribosomal protein S12 methylthiotransferase
VSGARGEGRAAHQGPDVDGTTTVDGLAPGTRVGALVAATVTGSDGADLLAEAI